MYSPTRHLYLPPSLRQPSMWKSWHNESLSLSGFRTSLKRYVHAIVARRKMGVSSNKCTGTTSSVGTTGGNGRRALKKGTYESSEDIFSTLENPRSVVP